jgi:hypothetical protein
MRLGTLFALMGTAVVLAPVASGTNRVAAVAAVLFAVVALLVYFGPTMVARGRAHPNLTAIAVLNLLAGWTFVGWVAARVWACAKSAPARVPAQ